MLSSYSSQLNELTAWEVSKYGPEKPPYLDTFHVVYDGTLVVNGLNEIIYSRIDQVKFLEGSI